MELYRALFSFSGGFSLSVFGCLLTAVMDVFIIHLMVVLKVFFAMCVVPKLLLH